MNELISGQKLIEEVERLRTAYNFSACAVIGKENCEGSCADCILDSLEEFINSQPPADQWIPVTYRETTEEERECGIEWKYILDCPLPDNDTEILVCTKAGSVWTDTFFNDDGCYLDGGYDLTEIAAWMPLPEPYKGE